tara:strand:- start:218 stop:1372 length:1155 start_codon:yes stop_codon:yes gene_type:complete
MNLNEKKYYCLNYAILGDIIGFGNGEIEFNYFKSSKLEKIGDTSLAEYTSLHIFNFITSGGFSKINFKISDTEKNIASDDSIMNLAVYHGLKDSLNQSNDIIIESIKDKLIYYYLNDKKNELRYYGNRTIKTIERLKDGDFDWKKFSYSKNAGGCGASMRSMPIGLFFHGKKNRDKLMEISIQSSRITHNNPKGYCGGFASALFTALAIENVNPFKWIDILIEFFENNKILNFIEKQVNEKFPDEFKYHKSGIIEFHYELINFKKWVFLNKNGKLELRDDHEFSNFPVRIYMFHQKFGSYPLTFNPGSNGLDSVLIAYDSLLRSKNNFEKLIYLSMLHAGDSDSTGCIAGALFGALYGNVNLPSNYDNFDLKVDFNNIFIDDSQ